MSDTYNDNWVPSGIPLPIAEVDPPEGFSFGSTGDVTFATGSIRVDGDSITTRHSGPSCAAGGGFGGGSGGGNVDGGTP